MRIQAFLKQSPLFAVRRAAGRFDLSLTRILKARELTFLEALVLVSVFFEEPKTTKPSDLAATLLTTRGNISHCISSLEAKDMVRRRIDPEDARAFQVILKPAGRSQAMRVIRTFDRLQKEFEKTAGAPALEAALEVLVKVERVCETF